MLMVKDLGVLGRECLNTLKELLSFIDRSFGIS